jgi:RES domain-containing protein
MIVYRICNTYYKDDISGEGAKIYGSRWNSKGVPILYTAEYISLAVLEMLVHIQFDEVPLNFHLLKIFLPDAAPVIHLKADKLKPNWVQDEEYTAFIGNEFVTDKSALCLKVPSAIVGEEHNYIINPLHPDFKKVYIASAKKFDFDKRLFRF